MSLNKLLCRHMDRELISRCRKDLDARTAWKTFSTLYRLAEKSERFPGDVKLMFMALCPMWERWAMLIDADEDTTSMVSAPRPVIRVKIQRLQRQAEKRKRNERALAMLCHALKNPQTGLAGF